MTVRKVNTHVKLRHCTKCSQLFVGVEEGVCLKCLKNEDHYHRTRKRGEPKEFIDYPELLEKWRARRRECISWRKDGMNYVKEKAKRQELEAEKSILLFVMTAINIDLDAVEELGSEITHLKRRIFQLESELYYARQTSSSRPYPFTLPPLHSTIPPDHWRRLVQLAHPDKHNNSKASTEVMQWLLKNKPM